MGVQKVVKKGYHETLFAINILLKRDLKSRACPNKNTTKGPAARPVQLRPLRRPPHPVQGRRPGLLQGGHTPYSQPGRPLLVSCDWVEYGPMIKMLKNYK